MADLNVSPVSTPSSSPTTSSDPVNRIPAGSKTGGLSATEAKKLRQACQEMESILWQEILRGFRRTIPESSLLPEAAGHDLFKDLLDEELAKEVSRSSQYGLADLLYQQLAGSPISTPAEANSSHGSGSGAGTPSSEAKEKAAATKNSNTQEKTLAAGSYSEIINRAAEKYNLPAALLRAVIKAESNFNPLACSSAGAMGLMQLMPSTARALGVDNPWDPEENIEGGSRYLRQLLDQYANNLPLALAAYNAGPGQVKKYGGIPPFTETRNYIQRILNLWSREDR